jgi:predicted restriction endonuclease
MAKRKTPSAKYLPIFAGYGMIANELELHPNGASSADVAAGISRRYGQHSGWTTRAAATEISWGRRSGYPFALRKVGQRRLWFLDDPRDEEVAVAMQKCCSEAETFVYPGADGSDLLQSLIGETLTTELANRLEQEVTNRVEEQVESRAFELFAQQPGSTRTVKARPDQSRFRRGVLRRYGQRCALCDIEALELIHAAHLVPDADRGTNDPRNGLPLCANHHFALDRGLATIEPVSTRVHVAQGRTHQTLGIQRTDLTHLPAQPADEALRFRWSQSTANHGQPVDVAA